MKEVCGSIEKAFREKLIARWFRNWKVPFEEMDRDGDVEELIDDRSILIHSHDRLSFSKEIWVRVSMTLSVGD
jgi:hypothetical protein